MVAPVMKTMRLLWLVALLAASPWVLAVDSVTLADPALQGRYLALTHEIRCVVCQGESIADSNADLAADFRRQVREMLVAGKSDQEVRDFMVARYGESILYNPPFNARTAWLWLAPGILLIVGALVAVRIQRQRTALVDQDNEPLEEDIRS